MAEGLYVYCIIGTAEARNFGAIGIGGRGDAVTTIAYRDLSAVVSSVPMERYVVGQEVMLTHERVIERVMKDHFLLPVRFYTVAPNAEEVRSLLRTRYAEFKRLLRELDNKVELGLKALWKDMNQVLVEILQEMPQKEAEAGESINVGAQFIAPKSNVAVGEQNGEAGPPQPLKTSLSLPREVRRVLDQKKAMTTELLLQHLRPLAGDLVLNRTYGDNMLMNAAFLVDRAREREFDARVERLSAQHPTIDLRYVGPVPPYSFVNVVIKEVP